MLPFEIYALGDRGLTVSFGNTINEQTNLQCIAFADRLLSLNLTGIRDVVPAYTTVSVYYDPLVIKELPGVASAQQALITKLTALLNEPQQHATQESRKLKVPVCYDPSLAPDLIQFAADKKLPVEEVIRLHTEKTYRVYMLGFLPGFPYMGTVDERLAAPRKQQPHIKLEAGSVGIAGLQTGIYPLDSPGGWNIIGQTPIRLFDPASEKLTFFRPGDTVSFYPISLSEFYQMKQP